MRSRARLTALVVGVLLLAAPAAWACGEPAAMSWGCPMAGSAPSMQGSACHVGSQGSGDCCDLRSAPEPIQVPALDGARPVATLEVAQTQVTARPAPAALPPRSTPPDASHLHDLGRYTLFSSFLL